MPSRTRISFRSIATWTNVFSTSGTLSFTQSLLHRPAVPPVVWVRVEDHPRPRKRLPFRRNIPRSRTVRVIRRRRTLFPYNKPPSGDLGPGHNPMSGYIGSFRYHAFNLFPFNSSFIRHFIGLPPLRCNRRSYHKTPRLHWVSRGDGTPCHRLSKLALPISKSFVKTAQVEPSPQLTTPVFALPRRLTTMSVFANKTSKVTGLPFSPICTKSLHTRQLLLSRQACQIA
jgi:hypothetical protein